MDHLSPADILPITLNLKSLNEIATENNGFHNILHQWADIYGGVLADSDRAASHNNPQRYRQGLFQVFRGLDYRMFGFGGGLPSLFIFDDLRQKFTGLPTQRLRKFIHISPGCSGRHAGSGRTRPIRLLLLHRNVHLHPHKFLLLPATISLLAHPRTIEGVLG